MTTKHGLRKTNSIENHEAQTLSNHLLNGNVDCDSGKRKKRTKIQLVWVAVLRVR